jgi:hypothetical protein
VPRETALVYLYPAGNENGAVLLSFGVIWSTVVILGRVAIGLVSWCLPHGDPDAGGRQQDTVGAPGAGAIGT